MRPTLYIFHCHDLGKNNVTEEQIYCKVPTKGNGSKVASVTSCTYILGTWRGELKTNAAEAFHLEYLKMKRAWVWPYSNLNTDGWRRIRPRVSHIRFF